MLLKNIADGFFTDISSKQKRTVLLVMKVGKKEGKRKLVYASTTGNTKKGAAN